MFLKLSTKDKPNVTYEIRMLGEKQSEGLNCQGCNGQRHAVFFLSMSGGSIIIPYFK